MISKVKLRSKKNGEINRFLSEFYNTNIEIENDFKWQKEYQNPVEISDIIGVFIDNIEKFDLKMWIILDKYVYVNITEDNANNVIKYLFERYPY